MGYFKMKETLKTGNSIKFTAKAVIIAKSLNKPKVKIHVLRTILISPYEERIRLACLDHYIENVITVYYLDP